MSHRVHTVHALFSVKAGGIFTKLPDRQTDRLTCIVPCNVAKGPGSTLLDPGVKLLQADNESIESTAVNDALSKLWGVLGNSSENKSSCLLVETLKGSKITRVTELNEGITCIKEIIMADM